MIQELTRIWQDVRYGLRSLVKERTFAFAVLLSLALGVGATTTVFSVIYAVIISPFPYIGANRMTRVVAEDKSGTPKNFFVTAWELQKTRELHSVESVLGQANWELSTTGPGLPEDIRAVFLTTNASSYFGVPPLLGRGLIPSDALEGQDPQRVVVLSYQFWKRYFDGRTDILNKSMELAHKTYTVVGVMPPRFAWSLGDVYLPLEVTNDPRKPVWISSVKLRAGTPQVAESEFQSLLEDFARATPQRFPESFRVHLDPLIDTSHGSLAHVLYALFTAVALLLFVGCANASILFLTRGVSRNCELALRAALGASRSRIVRQLLTESIALASAGALFGIVLSYCGLVIVVRWLPWSRPHEASIHINLPVLTFAVMLLLFTGILSGLWPALRLSRTGLGQLAQANARTTAGGLHINRTYALLIATQIGLTLSLLAGAGSAGRSFLRMAHIELGYKPSNTLVVGIPLHENSYMTWEKRSTYLDRLSEAIAEIPGVQSAAISTMATPPASGLDERVEVMGQFDVAEKQIRLNLVSSDYFGVLGMQLFNGRIWDHAESIRGANVAVVNQAMVRQYWPNGGAVGHSLRMPDMKGSPFQTTITQLNGWFEIIGVVADARNDGLVDPVQPAVYVPYAVFMDTYTHILVHTNSSPHSFFRAIREKVQGVDPEQQVEREAISLQDLISQQDEWKESELAARLLIIFGAFALVLAAIGLYSVVSYIVVQRTKEIGIRMALGAQRADVMKSVFVSASLAVGIGLVTGSVVSLAFGKILSSWVETDFRDPMALAGSAAVLLVTSALACLLPGQRACNLDPMEALRSE